MEGTRVPMCSACNTAAVNLCRTSRVCIQLYIYTRVPGCTHSHSIDSSIRIPRVRSNLHCRIPLYTGTRVYTAVDITAVYCSTLHAWFLVCTCTHMCTCKIRLFYGFQSPLATMLATVFYLLTRNLPETSCKLRISECHLHRDNANPVRYAVRKYQRKSGAARSCMHPKKAQFFARSRLRPRSRALSSTV